MGWNLVGLFACHDINAWIIKRVSVNDQRLVFLYLQDEPEVC